jgi:hypothetical protein
MKTRIPKAERSGCLGQFFMHFKSQTEFKELSPIQKLFRKYYGGLILIFMLLLAFVIFSSGTAQGQTTIPDGWYNSEVRVRELSTRTDTILNLYVKVKYGSVSVIRLSDATELCKTSDDYKFVGGEINCTFSKGELIKGNSTVYIWYPKKTLIYKILIH